MKRKGLTLIELLIAMALSMVVTGVLISMFSAGIQLSRRFFGEEEVFQRVQVVSSRLREVINETDLTLATYATDCSYLGVPGARGKGGLFQTDAQTGAPVWDQTLVFYVSDRKILYRECPAPKAWPILPKDVKSWCDGNGELLTKDVSKAAVSVENVTVVNDPIVTNQTVPDNSQVGAILNVTFVLEFSDRRGVKRSYEFNDRYEGWNSYARSAPSIEPTPTATPTPPNTIPTVPKDWSDS